MIFQENYNKDRKKYSKYRSKRNNSKGQYKEANENRKSYVMYKMFSRKM